MTERVEEKILPITWSDWDTCGDNGDLQFYDVEFVKDWGPYKAGQKIDSLCLLLGQGKVVQYDDNGQEIVVINVQLMSV